MPVAFRTHRIDFQVYDPWTEVLRAGARELLAQAVEAEVAEFLEGHATRLMTGGEFFLGVTLADVPAMLDRLEREFGTTPRVDETDEPEALPGDLQEPV